MNFWDFWRLYFTFNRSERRAIRILLVFVVIIILVNVFMPFLIQPKQWDHTPYLAMLDSMSRAVSYKDSMFFSNRYNRNDQFSDNFRKPYMREQNKLKPFNPNDLDEAGWQQLGLSEKQAAAVVNIKNRKGGFKNAEELKQVKFIPEFIMQRILPYLIFTEDTQQYRALKNDFKTKPENFIRKLDVNEAGFEEWKELPGIGNKLAERIIIFREKLGGFHRISQVCEVYGMPVETCENITPYLTINQKNVVKIQLNYASTEELARHPYISFKLASAIVSNRNARGFFKSVEEILTLGLVDKEFYDKLAPYLSVE
jgi:competence ComEA-like helix-hairpin-helix protein